MNGLVYHIASGQALFTGASLLMLSAFASLGSSALLRRVSSFAFLLGTATVVIASVALPYWLYAVAALLTAGWIISWRWEKWRRLAVAGMAIGWLVVMLIELPHHLLPRLTPAGSRSLTVIGDSITAGIGGDPKSPTWPQVLARQHRLQVQDISHVGDTAGKALLRAQAEPITAPVVLVEIGGNDLLGATSASQFAIDLEALLQFLAAPGRQVVMLELPSLPLYPQYGRIQRTLARKYRVLLAPKSVLLAVLAGGDATLDSLHLTAKGHVRMADSIWRLLEPAYDLDGSSA
ncbi:SGNH/GDSL hydrolase family protein [Lignipirellula cremea]|uniref:Esterase TesA n=1 Tax=Lignipirellula cremea TaxID=2528010 RepID=A0A518DYF9_9BACT|nr:GDSL-type esterase/lipase family protein [Lignipirellula cremea]QDU96878.1 Esterase TesA precursor [Lignipirellula cremea]